MNIFSQSSHDMALTHSSAALQKIVHALDNVSVEAQSPQQWASGLSICASILDEFSGSRKRGGQEAVNHDAQILNTTPDGIIGIMHRLAATAKKVVDINVRANINPFTSVTVAPYLRKAREAIGRWRPPSVSQANAQLPNQKLPKILEVIDERHKINLAYAAEVARILDKKSQKNARRKAPAKTRRAKPCTPS